MALASSQKAKARLRRYRSKQEGWDASCKLHQGAERPYRRGRLRCGKCGKKFKVAPYLGEANHLDDVLVSRYLDAIVKQLNRPSPLIGLIAK